MIAPLPKTVQGRTIAEDRAIRRGAETKAQRDCYRVVDARDGRRCRVCGCHVTPGAIDGGQRAEHHHLLKRSQGGRHEPPNVLTLCARCHDDVHVRGLLKLSGDADERNHDGRLAGVKVERLHESGWQVVAWV